MSLRDEFERLCPVPEGHFYSEAHGCYCTNVGNLLSIVSPHEERYQGFLLGRKNTVSAERYREDVEAGFSEGWSMGCEGEVDPDDFMPGDWKESQAKRRTEEV